MGKTAPLFGRDRMMVPRCIRSFAMTPTPTTVGLDLAKNVFHVHVADASGNAIDCTRLTRRELLPFFKTLPPCLVGIE
tara:strand:+ start:194 stop:427 length:234 start_codon:yes stop_codon:yes gene_type:complete